MEQSGYIKKGKAMEQSDYIIKWEKNGENKK